VKFLRPKRGRRVRRRVSPRLADAEASAEYQEFSRDEVRLAGPVPESLRQFIQHGI